MNSKETSINVDNKVLVIGKNKTLWETWEIYCTYVIDFVQLEVLIDCIDISILSKKHMRLKIQPISFN